MDFINNYGGLNDIRAILPQGGETQATTLSALLSDEDLITKKIMR